MKKLILFTALCVIISAFVQAQNKGKLQLDVEAPVKFSNGKGTRQIYNYKGIETLNYPEFTTYRNPVYGINIDVLYGLSESFKIGVGAGLNGEFFENSVVFTNEYYNMLMIPVYGKIRFQKNICKKMTFISDLNAGYQFYENRTANDTSGYYFIDKGGFLGGIDVGAGYRTSKYLFYIKLGYELNIYRHAYRLDWGIHPAGLNQNDIYNFYTYYRLINLTFGINVL